MIALLGLAETFNAHVLLAVDVFHVREPLGDCPGKFTVDHSIAALDSGESLLKMDVHRERIELRCCCKSDGLALLV